MLPNDARRSAYVAQVDQERRGAPSPTRARGSDRAAGQTQRPVAACSRSLGTWKGTPINAWRTIESRPAFRQALTTWRQTVWIQLVWIAPEKLKKRVS